MVPCIGAVKFAKLPMDGYLRWLLQEQCKGEDMPIYEYVAKSVVNSMNFLYSDSKPAAMRTMRE